MFCIFFSGALYFFISAKEERKSMFYIYQKYLLATLLYKKFYEKHYKFIFYPFCYDFSLFQGGI